MEGYIRVEPAVLEQMAAETNQKVNSFSNSLNDIFSVVENTAGYWQGDASEAFRNVIKQKNDAVLLVLSRFREWTVDLNTMGEVYRSAENKAKEISADLESDVIY